MGVVFSCMKSVPIHLVQHFNSAMKAALVALMNIHYGHAVNYDKAKMHTRKIELSNLAVTEFLLALCIAP